MALRIGFDLDGVLADMDSELGRQAQGLFGERTLGRLQEAQRRRADERSQTPAATVELLQAQGALYTQARFVTRGSVLQDPLVRVKRPLGRAQRLRDLAFNGGDGFGIDAPYNKLGDWYLYIVFRDDGQALEAPEAGEAEGEDGAEAPGESPRSLGLGIRRRR